MTCEQARATAHDLAEGGVPEEQRLQLHAHIAGCAQCAARFGFLLQLADWVTEGLAPVPDGFSQAVMARVAQEPLPVQAPVALRVWRTYGRVLSGVAAVALLAVALPVFSRVYLSKSPRSAEPAPEVPQDTPIAYAADAASFSMASGSENADMRAEGEPPSALMCSPALLQASDNTVMEEKMEQQVYRPPLASLWVSEAAVYSGPVHTSLAGIQTMRLDDVVLPPEVILPDCVSNTVMVSSEAPELYDRRVVKGGLEYYLLNLGEGYYLTVLRLFQ